MATKVTEGAYMSEAEDIRRALGDTVEPASRFNPNLTGCCGSPRFLDRLYVWSPSGGATPVAVAPRCGKCLKQAGDVELLSGDIRLRCFDWARWLASHSTSYISDALLPSTDEAPF